LDPRFVISNTVEDDGFSRAIDVLSTTYFGGGKKPLAKFSYQFSPSFSALLLDVCAGNCQRARGNARNDYKSDGDAQWIRSGRFARVLLFAHPIPVTAALTSS
jgi:hypothetical protein